MDGRITFAAANIALRGHEPVVRRAKILVRLDRLKLGNPGDVEPVGDGISEMRIHYGPGYRIYFKRRGEELVIILAGGDKSTQERDIAQAKSLASQLEK